MHCCILIKNYKCSMKTTSIPLCFFFRNITIMSDCAKLLFKKQLQIIVTPFTSQIIRAHYELCSTSFNMEIFLVES